MFELSIAYVKSNKKLFVNPFFIRYSLCSNYLIMGQRSGIVDPYSFQDQVARVRSRPRAAVSGKLAPRKMTLRSFLQGVWRCRCAASCYTLLAWSANSAAQWACMFVIEMQYPIYYYLFNFSMLLCRKCPIRLKNLLNVFYKIISII